MLKAKKGFTLIELLVVIAIIGLLAGAISVSFTSARKKARDSRRLSDIKSIDSAQALYYDSNNAYAATVAALAPDYIATEPKDPKTDAIYPITNQSGTTYTVTATLESPPTGKTLFVCDEAGCGYE